MKNTKSQQKNIYPQNVVILVILRFLKMLLKENICIIYTVLYHLNVVMLVILGMLLFLKGLDLGDNICLVLYNLK